MLLLTSFLPDDVQENGRLIQLHYQQLQFFPAEKKVERHYWMFNMKLHVVVVQYELQQYLFGSFIKWTEVRIIFI